MSIFESTERRDPKRYLWILGLIAPTCSVLPSQLVLHTGLEIFWWIGPIIVLVVIPLLDWAIGNDGSNPRDEDYEALSNDRYYRWCTYLFLPLQFTGLLIAGFLWSRPALSISDKLGLAVTLGFVSGIGINAAHELGHRVEHLERWLAKIALAQSGYGHFFIEHNRGHHVRVATPEDPASSRVGESFWAFWPRTVWGGFRSSWRLEKIRLERLGKKPWSPRNEVLSAWLMSVALYAVLIAVFGIGLLPYLILQAVVGFSLLEAVNYLEHYGLVRQRTASGRYERPAPVHSWNSDHIVTNIFLYHLQRHSDHHAYPTRRYQTLRSWDGAPNLPSGYASMILLAYFPPLWRRVMDKRVLAHYGGDITRANIHPAKRDKVIARYGAAGSGA